MRALTSATRDALRAAAASDAIGIEILPFLEAVVELVAHPLGASRPGDEAHELAIARRVVAVLDGAAGDGSAVDDAVAALVAEPEMLSAFFQSLDLLPASPYPAADAIAMLVVRAVGELA